MTSESKILVLSEEQDLNICSTVLQDPNISHIFYDLKSFLYTIVDLKKDLSDYKSSSIYQSSRVELLPYLETCESLPLFPSAPDMLGSIMLVS